MVQQPKLKKIFIIRTVRLVLSEIECAASKKDEKCKEKVLEYPKGEILTLIESHANENIGSGKALEYSEDAYNAFKEQLAPGAKAKAK